MNHDSKEEDNQNDQSESNNRVVNLLRWILVLPAGFVCMLLVSFPVHWVALATFKYGEVFKLSDNAVDSVERVMFAFFGPLVFVVAGAKVAPKYRMGVAITLSSFLILIIGGSLAIVLLNPSWVITTPVLSVFGIVSGILGLAAGLYAVKSKSIE